MNLRIGIALGDITGIGPEVTLKALAQEASHDETNYLLIGDWEHLSALNQSLGTNVPMERQGGANQDARFLVANPLSEPLPRNLLPGSTPAAKAAVVWLRDAAARCLCKEISAMVTAPVNKEAIIRAGESNFVGQTELLSQIAGTDRTAMMLLGDDDRGRWLRVVLATTHVPIKDVSANLTREKILLAIELAAKSCRDLGLPQERVAVCGLNPHAGEGGKIGTEEIETIIPAVEEARKMGFNSSGPFAADALFYYVFRGDYDVVVAMYHDQGLVPLKMIGFESGVNWTLGLPFIRTSPDHGTAYDIVGKNIANPSSMVSAIRLAKKLAGQGER
ncbi:MAG: 4-hydroxythreonine-4-phosphate dehydrogenase PdxA [Verrucomicrobia bacterium]|nr:4-hydroxythreonine-4-phosphate dehydrogenase PdxA [Verrucomicrobiota bacterium]